MVQAASEIAAAFSGAALINIRLSHGTHLNKVLYNIFDYNMETDYHDYFVRLTDNSRIL